MDSDNNKKISFFSAVCLAIGTIVGAGVFGTIPAAAAVVGNGIEWAYFVAFLSIIVCYLPQMVTISTLPAPFTLYMHATRIVNPTIGYMQVIYGFNYVFILSALAGVFAQYASVYINVDQKVLAIASLLIFAAITSFGVETNAVVQNIMVVCLFVALFIYMALGAPHLDPQLVSVGSVIAPKDMTLVAMGSAVALLSASLQGGISIAFYPDEIENPGKTVPRAFIVATGACCIVFMLVSIITIGVLPMDQVDSLLDIARIVLPGWVYHYFIIAGAIFAILTSLNGVFIASGHVGSATADDKVMPKWFGKRNKHNVPVNTVWMMAVVSALLVVTEMPIGTLLTAYSLLNLFCLLILFIPALKVRKLYPHSYRHASFKMSQPVMIVMTVLGVAVCLWQLFSTVITLNRVMIAIIIAWYVVWYAFFFGRKAWLKKQGFDLDAHMREPYPDWVENEKHFAEIDAKEDAEKAQATAKGYEMARAGEAKKRVNE